jgi:hypothetical protein
VIRAIGEQLSKLYDQYEAKTINECLFIKNITDFVHSVIARLQEETLKYPLTKIKAVKYDPPLDPTTIIFLANGEVVFEECLSRYSVLYDCSPVALEFGKAIEKEMHTRIFEPFRDHWKIIKQPITSNEDHHLRRFVEGQTEDLTLGSIATLFKSLKDKQELDKSPLLQVLKRYLNDHFLGLVEPLSVLLTHDIIDKLRNYPIHRDISTLETAKETKKWCSELFELLHNYPKR